MKHLLTGNLVLVVLLTIVFNSSNSKADDVILDDLVVVGSACIGMDCVTDQEFGFSTITLKENNLRILFDDTSTTAEFPPNDWEIKANDSTNGGQSYLGFADRGEGLTSASGQGICEGSPRHGLVCGTTAAGENCAGVCAGGSYNGTTCTTFPGSTCESGGGICEDEGVCVEYGAIIFRIMAGGPEDSLVIDNVGDVNIAGNLTVAGTINGNAGSSSEIEELQDEVEILQEEVDLLKDQIEALMSFPPLQRYLD